LNAVQQLASLGSRASLGTGADALADGAVLTDGAALGGASPLADAVASALAWRARSTGAELVSGDALAVVSEVGDLDAWSVAGSLQLESAARRGAIRWHTRSW
jgi:hypothetical protein